MKEVIKRPGPWVLLATIVGSSMSMIDGTAVNVALPALQRDFSASAAQLQWVVEGYAVFLSALILIGGSLGDLFGRKRVFAIGIGIFAVASIACGFAPSMAVLIVSRCLQGVGGALATPGSLALISASFSGAARGRAIGTWSAFSAVTSAIGPVLGGWLVQIASWRLVFFINIPLALFVFFALRGVDESRDGGAGRRVDYAGAALATAGLGALVYGIIDLQGSLAKPSALAVSAIVVGVLSLVAFVVVEARERSPMMRLTLFRSRTFSFANLYTFLLYGALGGSLYFVPFDAIDVQHYTPAAAGAALLPMIAILFVASRWTGELVARTGPRVPLAAGAAIAAGGFVLFSFVGVGRSYATSFLPAVLVLGVGLALLVAPLTTTVMNAVDGHESGIASAINNAVSRTAGLIAIAVLGIVLTSIFFATYDDVGEQQRWNVPAALTSQVREHAKLVTGRVPSEVRSPVERARLQRFLDHAYARAFSVTMLCSGGLCLLAAFLALGMDDGVRRGARPATGVAD